MKCALPKGLMWSLLSKRNKKCQIKFQAYVAAELVYGVQEKKSLIYLMESSF